ncbi:MAG: Yip1 family protein [Candidatus Altiarchaeota archaeon]
MAYCPHCDKTVSDDYLECPVCRVRLIYSEKGGKAPPVRPDATAVEAQRQPKSLEDLVRNTQAFKLSFHERIRGVLSFNINVFEDIARHQPWGDIMLIIVVGILLNDFFAFMNLFMRPDLIPNIPQQESLAAAYTFGFIIGLSIHALIMMVLSPLILVLTSLLMHGFLKLMGGAGDFKSTLAVNGYCGLWNILSIVIVSLLTLIRMEGALTLLLYAIVSLVTLTEMILAFERVHRISLLKSILAVILTVAAIGAIIFLLMVVVGLSLLSLASSFSAY